MADVLIGETPLGPSPREVIALKYEQGRAALARLLLEQRDLASKIARLEADLVGLSNVASLFPAPAPEPEK